MEQGGLGIAQVARSAPRNTSALEVEALRRRGTDDRQEIVQARKKAGVARVALYLRWRRHSHIRQEMAQLERFFLLTSFGFEPSLGCDFFMPCATILSISSTFSPDSAPSNTASTKPSSCAGTAVADPAEASFFFIRWMAKRRSSSTSLAFSFPSWMALAMIATATGVA
ncbi:hypothetical protein D3C76_1361960 [compost metagenome]